MIIACTGNYLFIIKALAARTFGDIVDFWRKNTFYYIFPNLVETQHMLYVHVLSHKIDIITQKCLLMSKILKCSLNGQTMRLMYQSGRHSHNYSEGSMIYRLTLLGMFTVCLCYAWCRIFMGFLLWNDIWISFSLFTTLWLSALNDISWYKMEDISILPMKSLFVHYNVMCKHQQRDA